jgi:transcriptional regulator with XRE-family HTH domain
MHDTHRTPYSPLVLTMASPSNASRILRHALMLTQEEFAALLGCSQATVSRMESEAIDAPSAELAEKLERLQRIWQRAYRVAVVTALAEYNQEI